MNYSPNYYNKNGQNKNNSSINENISNNKPNNFIKKPNSLYNLSNNSYINRGINKNKNYSNEEHIIVECICNNNNFQSKKDIIQCILCHKYQHLSCIFQAQYVTPYLCFNCQFKNNHFYLKWKKTILPAREIIYKKQWEDNKDLLKEGTKKFEFYLNIPELNSMYNSDNNNSHYLAFLCLTNNGKPFHLGFPDNINIQINNKQFYFTENKGFKRPLLLALDNSCKTRRRHLITSDKYDIQNVYEFFNTPRNSFSNNNSNKYWQKIIISFMGALETYVGSEFEFVEVRHYIIYIGLFQEIQIPQLSSLRNCNDLEQCNDMFKNLYREKVLKLKWNKVSNNITLGNDEMNMNLISNVSNQKIIHPVRGLFCQHSDVLDYGECCGYITSNSQVYKCFKCNKPLNIMYIDDMSEKIFNKYKNENYSQIYYTSNFQFIKGEKINDTKEKNQENCIKKNNEEDLDKEEYDDSLSDSFFNYYTKKEDKDTIEENNENNNNNLIDNGQNNLDSNQPPKFNNQNEIILIDSSDESIEDNNNNNNEFNNKENPLDTNKNDYINNNINDKINNNMNLREEEDEDDEEDFNSIQNEYQKSIGENINNNNNEPQKLNPTINEEIIILDDEEEDQEQDKQKENIFENFYNKNDDYNEFTPDNENESQQFSYESNNISEKGSKKTYANQEIESFDNLMNQKIYNNENVPKIINQKEKQRQNIFGIYFPEKNLYQNKEENKPKFLGEKRYFQENLDNEYERKKKENVEKELMPDSNIIKRGKKNYNKLTKNNQDKNPYNRSKKKNEDKNKKNSDYDNITIINNDNSSKDRDLNLRKLSDEKNILLRENSEPSINNNQKKRKHSEISSSSISFNSNNKQNNTNKNKKNKKKENNQKDRNHIVENDNIFSEDKEEEKLNNEGENEKKLQFMQLYELDKNKTNGDKKDNKYESILYNNKDMVVVRPYDELKRKRAKVINDYEENEEKFLNDFDIFENDMLNNRQNEFINYDYYNIQRRLREICSSRYDGDEIYNENKIFFKQFL